VEAELLPLLKEEGIGFYAYNPLMAGAKASFSRRFAFSSNRTFAKTGSGRNVYMEKLTTETILFLQGFCPASTRRKRKKPNRTVGRQSQVGAMHGYIARERIPATIPRPASYVGTAVCSGRSFSRSLYDLYRMARPGLSLCDSRKNLWR
jgi:hypothetical protein